MNVTAKWLLPLVAAALGGCATAPWADEPGSVCDFEFPFVNDYDIVNRTTFRWDDTFVTNNSAEYRQEIAGPMSALAASVYGYRLFTDIRSLMDMGFPPERLLRCYGEDLRYDDPKYGNIFNVINPEDIVPCVPFSFWGSQRFGHDLYLRSCNFLHFTGTWTHTGYVGMKNAHREICGYDYYHLLGGAHLKEKLGEFAQGMVPTVKKYYHVPPELRAEGKLVCAHSFLEMVLSNKMASAYDQARQVSLMSDMANISSAYNEITNSQEDDAVGMVRTLDHRLRFVRPRDDGNGQFEPDGRDFSQQPGVMDFTWQLSCTHSFPSYVSWMKSAESHGPESVFYNWDDEDDIPHNDWLLDDIF